LNFYVIQLLNFTISVAILFFSCSFINFFLIKKHLPHEKRAKCFFPHAISFIKTQHTLTGTTPSQRFSLEVAFFFFF